MTGSALVAMAVMCGGLLLTFAVALLRTSKESALVMEDITRAEAIRQLLAKAEQEPEWQSEGWEDAK
jgi:hypothetical protein